MINNSIIMSFPVNPVSVWCHHWPRFVSSVADQSFVPSSQRDQAGKLLAQLQEHPQAWSRVDQILEQSQSQSTKFFALAILEKVIQYRWKVLPRQQCDGIRNYIVNLIIKLSSDEATLQKERLFLKKLNITLVQVRPAAQRSRDFWIQPN